MRDKSESPLKTRTSSLEGASPYYEVDIRKVQFVKLDAIRSIPETPSGKARSGRKRSSIDPEAKVSGK